MKRIVCTAPAQLNSRGTACVCPDDMDKKGNSCVPKKHQGPTISPNDIIRGLPGLIGPGRGGNGGGGGAGPTRGGGTPGKP